MLQTYKSYTRRTLAMLLAVLVAVGALFSGSFPVHAADGTISYKAGPLRQLFYLPHEL